MTIWKYSHWRGFNVNLPLLFPLFPGFSLSFSGPSEKPRNNNAIIVLARHLEEGEETTGGGREEWGGGWVQAEKGKVNSIGPRLRSAGVVWWCFENKTVRLGVNMIFQTTQHQTGHFVYQKLDLRRERNVSQSEEGNQACRMFSVRVSALISWHVEGTCSLCWYLTSIK